MQADKNPGYVPELKKPDAVIGGCIAVFESAIANTEDVINDLEKLCSDPNSGIHWNRATTIGNGIWQEQRTNLDMSLTYYLNSTENPNVKNLHNLFYYLIVNYATSYHQMFGINESFWLEGFNILKYNNGQEYKAHYDSSTGVGRHISCLLYLNDDYTGGELEFPNFQLKIKPQKGMMILFPSNYAYTHIAHPVTDGTKYAFVTWLHDRTI